MAELVRRGPVGCVRRDVDRYGRIVAVCSVGPVDLGAAMVRAGHAVAYRQYSTDYVALEDRARLARAGAWAGEFVMPAVYRSQGQSGVAAAQRQEDRSSPGCDIKGNINRKGERIYHVPGDPYYGPTRPEAMFCSARQAEAGGFRRAGRPRR